MNTIKGAIINFRKTRLFLLTTLALLAVFFFLGCYGEFPITRIVHDFNGEVTDVRLVHTIIFWIFLIIPVYSIAMLADAIIFNLIEFWTGETINTVEVIKDDGSRIVLAPSENQQEAILTISDPKGNVQLIRFVKRDQFTCDVLDENSEIIGTAHVKINGDILLTDSNGRVIQRIKLSDYKKIQDI